MNLEQNNLDAKISLMKDIIGNDKNIIYHILERSKELMKILNQRKFDADKPIKTRTIQFTNEQFEKILDIVSILENESNYEKLGILAKTSVPDNVVKKKILSILQKG
jgi:hypothetical protein